MFCTTVIPLSDCLLIYLRSERSETLCNKTMICFTWLNKVASMIENRKCHIEGDEVALLYQQAYMAYKSCLNIIAEVYWLKIKTYNL